jgi:SAM-dependent methyltransferase
MEDHQRHWDKVYGGRDENALTWFEERPRLSLELIGKFARPGDAIIDVGAGASRLVDSLIKAGLGPLTVLDISKDALDISRRRLGKKADQVEWVAADITRWTPTDRFSVWHDRAVFHFLTDHDERAAYLRVMVSALDGNGVAIISTFAEDGPETCSGLPVARYSPASLGRTVEDVLPGAFRPVESHHHVHITPKGNRQSFQTSVIRKVAG